MSKTITLEIPDDVYSSVRQQAERNGLTAEKLALEILLENFQAPGERLADKESAAALNELMKFAGAADSGNSRSADNDAIDAELVRAYSSDL